MVRPMEFGSFKRFEVFVACVTVKVDGSVLQNFQYWFAAFVENEVLPSSKLILAGAALEHRFVLRSPGRVYFILVTGKVLT